MTIRTVDSYLRMACMLVFGGALLVFVTAWIMAISAIRPPRMTDGKAAWVLKRLSPGDLGLGFSPRTFQIRDERSGRPLRLAAWWIPRQGSDGRCVVLVHGYADAKVGAIAWAPLFHELGWNILALDLRAHGESEGKYTSAGFHEKHDLDRVLDHVRAEFPDEAQSLVLFGASLGAAAVLGAATLRDDLLGVIVDSPFVDFRYACRAHANFAGAPRRLVGPLAMKIAQWLASADFSLIRTPELVLAAHCPVMVIQGSADPYVPRGGFAAMEQVIVQRGGSANAYWLASDAPHLMILPQHPEEYRARVTAFLASLSDNPSPPQNASA